MELIESLDLFNKIKNMLSSAERTITVMSKELSDEIAEILLLKASKGIRVNVITKDTNWADWLESKKSSYGIDEIQNYRKEMNYNLRKERELKILQIILPIIIIGISVITGLFFKLFWIPILPGAIVSGTLIYYFNRLVRNFDNQIAVLKTMISQRETEIEGIRQEILKNLVVKVNKKVGFTVVIVDGKGIVTPLRLCNKENLLELTFFEELNEEKIKEIFKKLDNSS